MGQGIISSLLTETCVAEAELSTQKTAKSEDKTGCCIDMTSKQMSTVVSYVKQRCMRVVQTLLAAAQLQMCQRAVISGYVHVMQFVWATARI